MEPRPASDRPTPEMPSESAAHAGHDVLILAAAADHDPDPETLATIERMTAACVTCAAIAADLRFLAGGLASLPPELPAPRDFRITDVQAERLRGGGLLRRLLRPFGLDGLPGLQPLAGALVVAGLAGILLTNLPVSLLPSAASAPLTEDRGTAAGPAGGDYRAAGPSTVPQVAVSGPTAAGSPGPKQGSPAPEADGTPPQGGDTSSQASGAPSAGPVDHAGGGIAVPTGGGPGPPGWQIAPLTLLSIVLLVIGVGLLTLRLAARRID